MDTCTLIHALYHFRINSMVMQELAVHFPTSNFRGVLDCNGMH